MSKSGDNGLNTSRLAPDLPPWGECNVFCIHAYAGAADRACGWRGRLDSASPDPPICPRCRQATLLRIPADNQGGRAQ